MAKIISFPEKKRNIIYAQGDSTLKMFPRLVPTIPSFDERASANREKISESLVYAAEVIKGNHCENQPFGIVLVLVSGDGCEVLSVGVSCREGIVAGRAVEDKFMKKIGEKS